MKNISNRSKTVLRFFVLQFIFFSLLLGGFSPFAGLAYAETVRPAKVEIPIYLEIEGEDNPAENFRFIIEAKTSSSNLPIPDIVEINLSENSKKGEAKFPELQFKEESSADNEKFVYQIRQLPGNNENMQYDTRSYTVKIRVNRQDKDMLGNNQDPYYAAALVVTEDGSTDPAKLDMKQGKIVFINKYIKPVKPTEPPKPIEPPTPTEPPEPKVPKYPPPPTVTDREPKIFHYNSQKTVEFLKEIPKICSKVLRATREVVTGDESGMFFFGTSFSLSVFGVFLYFFNRDKRREKREKHEWD